MASSTAELWSEVDSYVMTTGILDFTSGQMSSLLGHSHPEVVEVVKKYVSKLDHLLSNMITHPVLNLTERLAKFLPSPLQKSFFLNTGSESTEAAIKITECYTGKFEIGAFSASYHGLIQVSSFTAYSTGRRRGGPTMPGSLAFPETYGYALPSESLMGHGIGRLRWNLAGP
ncbi:2,2-dialkylglycine decarboxylase [Fusarium sporotrichioides]|uniref:2,2-dialkylglycine decarboxylase n=1 Tax=Fusarium sporotrichioides TaxID=5514 RepID=A0A395SI86_FUSSP|nr:2,2-dialkylglycine decarboxylase [Fusarium sporotrichioides]